MFDCLNRIEERQSTPILVNLVPFICGEAWQSRNEIQGAYCYCYDLMDLVQSAYIIYMHCYPHLRAMYCKQDHASSRGFEDSGSYN